MVSHDPPRTQGTRDNCNAASFFGPSHHVIPNIEWNTQDPTTTKERVYRWLKRQFIDLSKSSTLASRATASETQGFSAVALATVDSATSGARRDQEGGFISWDSARELLRQAPFCLENSLALDLPCLSKDLWTEDLVDVGRTSIVSSLQ